MRKLFLTSAGLVEDVTHYFMSFVRAVPNKMMAAFIPTAANPDSNPWWVKKAYTRLGEPGIKIKVVDLEKTDVAKDPDIFKGCGAVYVAGGNTFYLMKFARLSGFDKILPKLLAAGVVYVGESAGSVIAGRGIEHAGWKDLEEDENIVGLEDLSGLNLVPYGVYPHYKEGAMAKIKEKSGSLSYKIKVLNDFQAIQVEGERSVVVGRGEEIFVD